MQRKIVADAHRRQHLPRYAAFRLVQTYGSAHTPELLVEKSVVPREDDSGLAIEMMSLPSKLQEVLLLYYYQGMTIAEVGKILGISKVTVSHRLKQAKERLRGALKGGGLRD